MPTADPPAPKLRRTLSDEQLTEVLRLIKGVDSIELKVTVPESQRYATAVALGIDPLMARVRQVVFFDTPDLRLDAAGVVVRARRIQDAGADTAVKIRPVDPSQIARGLREEPGFKIELDAMPGGFVCSASFRGISTNDDILATVQGRRPLRKLFSKAQRAFYAEHAPADVTFDDLVALGPIALLKLKYQPAELGRAFVLEQWGYPDGSRILELSTKCPPREALTVAEEVRLFLQSKGVDLSGRQQTKTKAALSFFSKELQAAGARAAAS
jgi:hypothetical protein